MDPTGETANGCSSESKHELQRLENSTDAEKRSAEGETALRPSSGGNAAKSGGEGDCEQDGDQGSPRVDVMYTLFTSSGNGSWKSFFRDRPFLGVDFKLSDSSQQKDDNEDAIVYVCAQVEAQDLAERPGNNIRNWRRERADFDFGEAMKLERVMGQEITIGSERLVKVLDSVIDYDPEQSSLGSHLVDYLGNYRTLLFHYDDLYNLYQEHIRGICDESQRAEATRGVLNHGQNRMYLFWDEFARSQNAHDSWDKETGAEVAVLLRLIGPHYRSRMSPVVCKLQSSRPLVAFENLWLLYKPGSIVYKRRNDTLLGLVVVGATKFNREPAAEKAADRVTHYEVEAWYYEYNGNVLTRTSTISRIEQYEGDQSILSLPLIPAKIYDKVDGGIGRSRLRTRGERLLEITKAGFAHRMYAHSRSSYHGQIVLDPAVYNERLAEQKRYQDRCSRDYEWQWDVLPEEDLDPSMEQLEDPEPTDGRGYKRLNDYHELDPSKPEQYQLLMPDGVMLLYPRVGGLALTTKRWMRFEIEGISRDIPCAQPNQLQECLVAHEDDREVLRTALCKYPDQADFVPGKGEGQVFLLHGPPGTGKTLTAECVANDLRRPLISLTWNDFHGAGGEEQFLRRWFDLASKWGAILLIDEADVFLEKRSAGGYQNYTVTSQCIIKNIWSAG